MKKTIFVIALAVLAIFAVAAEKADWSVGVVEDCPIVYGGSGTGYYASVFCTKTSVLAQYDINAKWDVYGKVGVYNWAMDDVNSFDTFKAAFAYYYSLAAGVDYHLTDLVLDDQIVFPVKVGAELHVETLNGSKLALAAFGSLTVESNWSVEKASFTAFSRFMLGYAEKLSYPEGPQKGICPELSFGLKYNF